MTEDSAERTYTVGRGKPPAHTRFKPGQSGNPKGRPRGSVDLRQAVHDAANERVTITENGRQLRLRKVEIAARQLANKAAAGDRRAIELLSKLLSPVAAAAAPASPADKAQLNLGDEDDLQVLAAYMSRSETGCSP